ncbi:MAG TPA: amidohydrolase family protein [Stellaceae bacterium]|nr:amidohydrolase family protein [Stellaceae bacterium]
MRIIAIEEHYSTPLYRQKVSSNESRSFYMTSRSEQLGHDIGKELDDLGETRLQHMDAAGVDLQVLSFNGPVAPGFPAGETIAMAKELNDRLAAATKAHPKRFAGFAALPTAAPEAAADELERCVRDHRFVGAMIHGHTMGRFLDDQQFWPIFRRAETLGVPIYLHPALPNPGALKAYFEGYEDILARPGWGFAVDTSIHFLRILFSGAFDAFPKLQFIMGHLGEGLPFAMHRLDDHTAGAAKRRGLAKTPLEYIRDHLHVTMSGNWFEPAFVCTLLAMGADRILWAIDWPYEANRIGMAFWNKIGLSDGDREKIAHRNAELLLRL